MRGLQSTLILKLLPKPTRRTALTGVAALLFGWWSAACLAGEGSEAPQPTSPEESSVFPRAQPAGVPSMQVSTEFVTPASFGNYQPMGEMASRGIRVAPFTIRAALQAGVGYNDNVTLAPANGTSSMFFTLNPTVTVGLEGATQAYHVIYRGNYGRYSSSSADNYEDHNFGLSAKNAWTTRLRTQVNYDFLKGHAARGASSTAVAEIERLDSQVFRGLASYGAEGAQGRIEGDFVLSEIKYLTNRATTAVLDFDRAEVGGGFSYRVAPRTRALAQVRRAEISHPNNPAIDSTEMRYLVGVTWQASAKMEGTVRAGYATRHFSDRSQGGFSGLSYDAVLQWSPLTYSVFDLALGRSLAESSEVGAGFVIGDTASLTWTHRWSMPVTSTIRFLRGRFSYEGLSREDDYQSIAASATYPLGRSVRVGVELRHDSRESSVPGTNYRRNITLITLETAL